MRADLIEVGMDIQFPLLPPFRRARVVEVHHDPRFVGLRLEDAEQTFITTYPHDEEITLWSWS